MLISLILVPAIAGILCLLVPKKVRCVREGLAVLVSLAVGVVSVVAFSKKPLTWTCSVLGFSGEGGSSPLLVLDDLSGMVVLGVAFFSVLIAIYSIKGMAGVQGAGRYYACFLWTLGAACGAALANDFILLLVMWGFLGLTLYLLISLGETGAETAAKKTFIIVGIRQPDDSRDRHSVDADGQIRDGWDLPPPRRVPAGACVHLSGGGRLCESWGYAAAHLDSGCR